VKVYAIDILNKNLTYKSFVKIFLYVFLIVNGVVFTINFLVDPYGDRDFLVKKIYKPIVNERAYKYDYIFYKKNYKKYDSYILGSSRVMNIDPDSIKKYTNSYNFGVHAANNKEKLFLLKELLKSGAKVDTVYLGIDFFNFNISMRQHFLDEAKFKSSSFENYLSFSMLKDSIKSIKNQLKKEPKTYIVENGLTIYYEQDQLIKNNKYDFSDKRYQEAAKNYVKNDFIEKKFQIDEKSFEALKDIKTLCDKSGIKLYVFITPNHEMLRREFLKHKEIYEKIKLIKKRLKMIFKKVYDFSVEDKENKINQNFYDIVHYRSVLGKKIIETFYGDYGYGKILKKDKDAI